MITRSLIVAAVFLLAPLAVLAKEPDSQKLKDGAQTATPESFSEFEAFFIKDLGCPASFPIVRVYSPEKEAFIDPDAVEQAYPAFSEFVSEDRHCDGSVSAGKMAELLGEEPTRTSIIFTDFPGGPDLMPWPEEPLAQRQAILDIPLTDGLHAYHVKPPLDGEGDGPMTR